MRLMLALMVCSILLTGSLVAQNSAVLMEPKTALREQNVYITIATAASAKTAEVRVNNAVLKAVVNDKTVKFSVPKDFPLGKYPVSVLLDDQQYYPAGDLSVAASLIEKPAIEAVEPQVAHIENEKARWKIFGQGFATQSKDDIRLLVNGSEYTVTWDGCAAENIAAKPEAVHGDAKSSRELEVCNVPVLQQGKVKLAIQQGTETASFDVNATTWQRWLVLLTAFLVTAAAAGIVYFLLSYKTAHRIKGRQYKFRALFMDKQTNTYSLSILQFHLWTIAAVFGYTYFAVSRFYVQWVNGLPEISGNLPGIVGIGVGTAIGSQIVNTIRPKGGGEEGPSPSDFITSGGAVAPDRVQMLVWTLIAVTGFLAGVIRENPATIQNLPGVPDSLMALMGLSSAGYLGAKFARKPGPNIMEISIMPGFAQRAKELPRTNVAADLSQPITVATQALQSVKAMAAGLSSGSAAVSVREVTNVVGALEASVSAATAIQKSGTSSDGLTKLAELSSSSHAAALNAAAEFDRLSGTPGAETARLGAALTQRAAAAVEELAASCGQIVSVAEATANRAATDAASSLRRVIEFRGQNLSAEGIFRATIDGKEYDLPFRMLEEKNNHRAPEVIVVEESSGSPRIGRTLRLTIAPSQLDDVDRKTYDAIFGQEQQEIAFAIFNPDGQKSVKTVVLPPGEAQRS